MNDSYKKKYLKYKNKYYNIKGGSVESGLGLGILAIVIVLLGIYYFYNSNSNNNNININNENINNGNINNENIISNNIGTSTYLEQFLKNTNNGLIPPNNEDIKLLNKHLLEQQNEEQQINSEILNNTEILKKFKIN
tara:strand:+ start:46 stop:456 length:411 start_codon:yes stop_codon:yes gene_type:complete